MFYNLFPKSSNSCGLHSQLISIQTRAVLNGNRSSQRSRQSLRRQCSRSLHPSHFSAHVSEGGGE